MIAANKSSQMETRRTSCWGHTKKKTQGVQLENRRPDEAPTKVKQINLRFNWRKGERKGKPEV